MSVGSRRSTVLARPRRLRFGLVHDMTVVWFAVKLWVAAYLVLAFACVLGAVVGSVGWRLQRAATVRENDVFRAGWVDDGIARLESMANHPSNRGS